ncbi:gas vesicle protein K [Aminithiophilus ramosus]|uniref:Gas vesicle protein K n=2 Tax=Synergistales TaxID=649776 RepID=A0A9Q7AMH0_9BACT|nr:gas vesicle protein GvpK [Aminithiophilus ramosus]QTX32272.1 gas vesicle protein K [Aminithiophilus ramosus]QVL36139.1 gas vesicle protein K [Synergistota bacterium]HCU22331.1 gas vesicle protein K [Candidatus Atribacteria bacterium]
MSLNIDEGNLKQGLLGLVVALVEVIRDALKIEAVKRMDEGSIREAECERLGEALMELEIALEEIKKDNDLVESVQAVRDGLDQVVGDVLDRIVNPERWRDEIDR